MDGTYGEYRVVLWEQPSMDDVDPELIGWGEMTIDLVDVEDVHEAIGWAERRIVEDAGAYSRGGDRVRDREYVLYAKVPGEDRSCRSPVGTPRVTLRAKT